MRCSFCGGPILVDEEYCHYPNLDMNFHTDCVMKDEDLVKREKRIKEE